MTEEFEFLSLSHVSWEIAWLFDGNDHDEADGGAEP